MQTVSTTARVDPAKSASRQIRDKTLVLGYVPLLDSAPLVVAQEMGLFARKGLEVRLSKEPGWASVREKIRLGELDAAQAPASMVFELNYGLGVKTTSCLTALVTAHNGNSVQLSEELWELGVRDAYSLRRVIEKFRGRRRFRFAGVLTYSSQHYLMRQWLCSGGIDPDRDVDMAVVPPPQVSACLKHGHLDGFCVAEPWGSLGVEEGYSWTAALTRDLNPWHPEKVFLVRETFHRNHLAEHLALLAALLEAARFCDDMCNRAQVAAILAKPAYIGLPESLLRRALVGPYQMGHDRETDATDLIAFHHDGANCPTTSKARWVVEQILGNGLSQGMPRPTEDTLRNWFRMDLFQQAAATMQQHFQLN